MDVMAIAADDLGFANGMRGYTVRLRTDYRVALIAEFALGGPFQYRIGCMYAMTADACYVLGLVNTRTPVHLCTALMTLQAGRILLFNRLT